MREDIIRRAAAADAAAIKQKATLGTARPLPPPARPSTRAVWITVLLLVLLGYITQIDGGQKASAAFFVLAPLAAATYLLPSFVAYKRARRNSTAILLLNLLLGWTFIGWVLALVWATTMPSAPAMTQSGRMGLGELAARTAVRATVWETVFSVFRLMR